MCRYTVWPRFRRPGGHYRFSRELLAAPARTFYYVEMILGTAVFTIVFVLIARFAIPDPGGRPIGIGAAILALATTYLAIRTPYVAIVAPDGSLTFKALTRSSTTNLSAVYRITNRAAGRGGSTWSFYFDGGSAQMGGITGRDLARCIIAANSAVEYPPRLVR